MIELERPAWLLAFLPLFWQWRLLWRHHRPASNWKGVVEPALLRALLLTAPGRRTPGPLPLYVLASTLAVLALAGPVLHRGAGELALGPWLLPLLLGIAAAAFRRNWIEPGR